MWVALQSVIISRAKTHPLRFRPRCSELPWGKAALGQWAALGQAATHVTLRQTDVTTNRSRVAAVNAKQYLLDHGERPSQQTAFFPPLGTPHRRNYES